MDEKQLREQISREIRSLRKREWEAEENFEQWDTWNEAIEFAANKIREIPKPPIVIDSFEGGISPK